MSEFKMYRSRLDEERFGVRTVQARHVTLAAVEPLESLCAQEQAQLSIVRVDARELAAVQALEARGYRLMDTLLHYARDLERHPAEPVEAAFSHRPAVAADEAAVHRVARVAFDGYGGHYHADPRLPRERCDELYTDWATRSLHDRNLAQWMRVAEIDGQVVSFVTARMNSADDGEVVLSGVLPEARQHGIYRTFMRMGAHWCQQQGARRLWFITQITNVVVQRVYVQLEARFDHGEYTLHRWFD